jgi:hypothetical protein
MSEVGEWLTFDLLLHDCYKFFLCERLFIVTYNEHTLDFENTFSFVLLLMFYKDSISLIKQLKVKQGNLLKIFKCVVKNRLNCLRYLGD